MACSNKHVPAWLNLCTKRSQWRQVGVEKLECLDLKPSEHLRDEQKQWLYPSPPEQTSLSDPTKAFMQTFMCFFLIFGLTGFLRSPKKYGYCKLINCKWEIQYRNSTVCVQCVFQTLPQCSQETVGTLKMFLPYVCKNMVSKRYRDRCRSQNRTKIGCALDKVPAMLTDYSVAQ